MRIVHLPVFFKKDFFKKEVFEKVLIKLPNQFYLFSSIQYLPYINRLKYFFEKNNKKVFLKEAGHGFYKGQLLGCSMIKLEHDVFFIGDGFFHPSALLFNNPDKKVFSFNPKNNELKIYTYEDIKPLIKKRMLGLALFHKAKNIGVLITIKPGQKRDVINFLEHKFPEKNFFYFIADTFDFASLEDFPFIELFINTACPRIIDDNNKSSRPIINIGDLGYDW